MSHQAPGIREVGAEKSGTCCSGVDSGGGPGNRQIHDATFISQALDRVRSPIFGQFDGAVVGIEASLIIAEINVGELGGRPDVGYRGVAREDFCGKLAGNMEATGDWVSIASKKGKKFGLGFEERSIHHITIDDLGTTELPASRHEVEGLRLHRGRVHGPPF